MPLTGLSIDIEIILNRADKIALKMLSPRARSMIIALRSLRRGPRPLEDLLAECASMGFSCRAMRLALQALEELELVEYYNNTYRLTEYGVDVADAIYDVISEMRDFTYNTIEGNIDEGRIYAHLVTSLASTIGVVESFAEDKRSLAIALTIHTYVSTLSATIAAFLAEKTPYLIEIIRRISEIP